MSGHPVGGVPVGGDGAGGGIGLRGAFFDLDGTLIDREPLMGEAVRRVLARAGVALTDVELADAVGRAWTDVHERLGVAVRTGLGFAAFMDEVLPEGERLLADGYPARVLPGGAALVRRLAGQGAPVVLVTGSLRREAEAAVALLGIADALVGVLAAEDYDRGKPDPSCYLAAVDLVGAGGSAGSCVAFEDSVAGVLAGRAAGVRVVATLAANAPPGHPRHQDLGAADRVVPGLDAVDDHLLARLVG